MFDPTKPKFHWRDGLYFQRQEDGAVIIVQEASERCSRLEWTIPAAEWASIVAHVSADGGTAQSYQASQAVHTPRPRSGK